jgi:hypothetical protein
MEALVSQTCLDLLRKGNIKPKQVVKSTKVPLSDPSEIAERNSRKEINFHKDEKNNAREQQLQQANYLMVQVQNEVSLFRKLLIDEDMLGENSISTRRFWMQYKSQLPNLFSLTKKLLNVQASTAFVERFFSICRIICNVKNTNMSDKMIIMRSILKTNMETLDNLTIEGDI